jgi:hypothetical protein
MPTCRISDPHSLCSCRQHPSVGCSHATSHTGYREPVVYNFKVFTSLCRQVYIAEKLAPPTNLSSWATAYAKIWSRATNPQWYRTIAQNGEWAKVGIYVGFNLRVIEWLRSVES